MTLELKIANIDEAEVKIAKKRSMPFEKFYSSCLQLLREANFDGLIEITRLKDYSCSPINGSRIPFVIKASNGAFLMKSYSDTEESQHEKEVIRTLNGFHAPKPIYIGKRFLIEEILDYPHSLSEVFIEHSEKAIKIGAETRADFMSKGVTFHIDKNWMTDFVFSNGECKCLDFGHARLIYEEGETSEIDSILNQINRWGDNIYIKDRGGIPYLRLSPEEEKLQVHQEALTALLSIKADKLIRANIYHSIKNALLGVRNRLDHRYIFSEELYKVPEIMESVTPIFIKNFSNRFRSITSK